MADAATVTVVIPAFNEGTGITPVIGALRSAAAVMWQSGS